MTASPRRFIAVGATMVAVGVIFSAMAPEPLGSLVTLTGWAILLGGLHTLGRSGPDSSVSHVDADSATGDSQP